MVKQGLCIPHGQQNMLLGRNVAEIGIVDCPSERDVRMSFYKTGHQGSAERFNHNGAVHGELVWCVGDGLDASAFDKHIGGKRGRTTTIPHAGTAEKNWFHGSYLLNS